MTNETEKIRVAVNGYGVISENVDAIRALTSRQGDSGASIAATNTALNIGWRLT